MPKPIFLLDTGPLITLCAFPAQGRRAYVHVILDYADIGIAEEIAREALHDPPHPGAKIFRPLLDKAAIRAFSAPKDPAILDDAYQTYLGSGERAIIRLGLMLSDAVTVLDDKSAFQVASRFRLRAIGTHDMIIALSRDHYLPTEKAIEIVKGTSSRYPKPFLIHTLALLDEVK